MLNIAIIGAGAAGLMAAINAKKDNNTVTIFEKNEKIGKKLYITGKGRCNITNACSKQDLFDNILKNPKFCYSAINAFDNFALIDFLETNGLKTITERGNRVYPKSEKSSDVIKTLERCCKTTGVKIMLNSNVTKIEHVNEKFIIHANKKTFEFEALIIATGGMSYPGTGSTGDGYNFAKSLGHTITEITPSLVPFNCDDPQIKKLMGISLKNVALKAYCDNKEKFSDIGEMLFTHFGVSGPLVLKASCHVDIKKPCKLVVDLKPGLDENKLDLRILRDFEANKNKQIKNVLSSLLLNRLIPVILLRSDVDGNTFVNNINKAQRQSLIKNIKNFEIKVSSFRSIKEAIITRGGINVKEVNPKDMQSKVIKNLYFAGELLDIDAYTGGFNLQIAFSTGHLAGESVAAMEEVQ